jgi:hypothetical protein
MPLGFQVVSPAVQPAAGYRGSERFSAALSNHTVTVIGSVLIAQHFTRTSTSSRDRRRRRTTPLRRRLPAMAHRTMRCATGVPARSARSSLIRAETKRASSSRPTSKRGSRPTRPAGIRISSRSGPTRIAVWRKARSLPIRPTRLMSTHGRKRMTTQSRTGSRRTRARRSPRLRTSQSCLVWEGRCREASPYPDQPLIEQSTEASLSLSYVRGQEVRRG